MLTPRRTRRAVPTSALLALGLLTLSAPAAADECGAAQAAIDALAKESPRTLLYRAASHMSATALPGLAARATAPGLDGLYASVALGLTREASARPLLLGLKANDAAGRLGIALGLLALGDASRTGTITKVLERDGDALKPEAARALARMRAMRPKMLLYPLLGDPDPDVRRRAGVALASFAPKARRAVAALLDHPDPVQRRRAGRAMVSLRPRPSPGEIERLPDPWFARAAAHRIKNPRLQAVLRMKLRSPEQDARAAALGALLLADILPPANNKGAEDEAEREMAKLLAGKTEPTPDALAIADRGGVHAATLVLWSFAGGRGSARSVDDTIVRAASAAAERWIVSGLASEGDAAKLIASVGRLDGGEGARLARARVLGPTGLGLTAALKELGVHGVALDVGLLAKTAARLERPADRVEANLAALRLCGR